MTILRDQIILIGGYEITSSMNAIDLKAGLDANDRTVLGNSTRVHGAGLENVTAGGSGFYSASVDSALNTNLALHDTPITFLSDDTIGSAGYSFKSLESSYTPLKGAVGDEHQFDLEAVGRGDLIRGFCAYKGIVNSDTTSTAFVLGAASASQILYGVVHIYSVSGTNPTLDMKAQSDTVGFPSATDRITFDQITAIGSQWKTLAGAITDTYYRLDFNVGGTNPEFGIGVFLAIQ